MFIEVAIASALAPPSSSTRPGTVGRNAGRTTPDVLLYTETTRGEKRNQTRQPVRRRDLRDQRDEQVDALRALDGARSAP